MAALKAIRAELEYLEDDEPDETIVSSARLARRAADIAGCNDLLGDLRRAYPRGIPRAPAGTMRFVS
jgi:hypothetical protein